MHVWKKDAAIRVLSTTLAASGLALLVVTATGCDGPAEQVATGQIASDSHQVEYAAKLAVNHNESFVTG